MARGVVRVEVVLDSLECAHCGIDFALPQNFIEQRRDDGKTFWCPSGHGNVFGDSLQKQLVAEQDRNVALQADLDRTRRARLQAETAVLDKTKEIARMQRRSRAGVCQLCHRHFVNVEQHVATKHPEPGVEPKRFPKEEK